MQLVMEIQKELTEHILPFWHALRDDAHGGFYGEMDFELNVHPQADKACLINSRILWFFASAYYALGDASALADASHAYAFLKKHCLDAKYGGVYWSLDYQGNAVDETKHTYNQAFAIYALSAYYKATKDEEALSLAMDLYHLIESKCKDADGYLESFAVDFCPQSNEKLSENGVMAERTMNTLLHVFEGYTGLYEVCKSEEVAQSMRFILDVFAGKMYNPEKMRQEVFFDKNYHSLIDLHSYGHDIEASWLIAVGVELLGDEYYLKTILPILSSLGKHVYETAYVEQSLCNECEKGIVDETRVWWVQAEAVVGFLNLFQKEPANGHYLEAASGIWLYIKAHLIDPREGGEWFWDLSAEGKPISQKNIVEDWKGPYHNGRMCLEVMRRMKHDS